MSGLFIAFEGGEGVGKSTQEALLGEFLSSMGKTVVRTREPGGTPAAEAIRAIVLSREFDGMNARSEALLFAASRGDHVERVIRPALERGDIVICDRYIDSSVAYQGYARNLGAEHVRNLSLWATNNLLPDLTIVLTMNADVSLQRISNPDRLEAEPIEYHRAVTQAFLDLAEQDPERYLVINATQSKDAIAQLINARVMQELNG
jgi:dTMP kinase